MTLDDNDLPENPVQIYEDANETPDNENFFTSEDLNKTGKRKKPGPDE